MRLREFTDARKLEVTQATHSTAPIYPELEIETLTFPLTKLREIFSVDDPRIRQIFGKQSPRELATAVVKGTGLRNVAVRKGFMEGGNKSVEASRLGFSCGRAESGCDERGYPIRQGV